MFCTQCGAQLQEGDRFCMECGEKIMEDTPPVVKPKQEPRRRRMDRKSAAFTDAATWEDFNQGPAGYVPDQNYPSQRENTGAELKERMRKKLGNLKPESLPSVEVSGLRKIYFIDFLTRLFQKENLWLCAYLALNVVIIGLIACMFFALPLGWGMLTGLILYIGSICVALSPIGEWMIRRETGCKIIQDKAIVDRLEPIFNEVYYRARKKEPSIPDNVSLFMNDDPCPNAFATGRRTMCITRGLLSMDDDRIKATLGHEFGHLAHKDTDRILVVSIGNTVITAICTFIQISLIISEFMMTIFSIFMGEDGIFVRLWGSLCALIGVVFVNLFMRIWSWIGVMLCMKTSRNNEYQADRFSVDLGYGTDLVRLLQSLGGGGKPQGLFANLASSHPDTDSRIAHIREAMNEEA